MKGPMACDLAGCPHIGKPRECRPSVQFFSTPTEWGSVPCPWDHRRSSHLLSWNREVPVLLSLKLPVLREATCSQKSKWRPSFPRNIHRLPLLQAASQRIIPFCGSWLRVHPSSQAHYSSDYSQPAQWGLRAINKSPHC